MNCFGERRENNLLWHPPFHLIVKNVLICLLGWICPLGWVNGLLDSNTPIDLKAPYCEKSEHRLDTHVAFYFFHLLARPNNRAQAIYFRSHTNCLYLIKVVLLFGCGGKKESFHRPDCAPWWYSKLSPSIPILFCNCSLANYFNIFQ